MRTPKASKRPLFSFKDDYIPQRDKYNPDNEFRLLVLFATIQRYKLKSRVKTGMLRIRMTLPELNWHIVNDDLDFVLRSKYYKFFSGKIPFDTAYLNCHTAVQSSMTYIRTIDFYDKNGNLIPL